MVGFCGEEGHEPQVRCPAVFLGEARDGRERAQPFVWFALRGPALVEVKEDHEVLAKRVSIECVQRGGIGSKCNNVRNGHGRLRCHGETWKNGLIE